MPKMPDAVAAEVDATEGGSFAPIPPGVYPAVLTEVNVKEGAKGPYWQWVYEIPEGREYAGRRFWNNTSMSEAARFKVKEAFDAHGVPANTDTDELVGTWVSLSVSLTTIQSGEKAGQPTNNVANVLPYQAEDGVDVAGAEEPF